MGASPQSYRIRQIRRFVRTRLPSSWQRTGRPPSLTDIDLATIIIWDGLCEQHQTIKGIYTWIGREYSARWPQLPTYETFLRRCHHLIPILNELLQSSLKRNNRVVCADSSLLPVCKNHKAGRHRVAKGAAKWGRNHQGWTFGFKVHLASTICCRLQPRPSLEHRPMIRNAWKSWSTHKPKPWWETAITESVIGDINCARGME